MTTTLILAVLALPALVLIAAIIGAVIEYGEEGAGGEPPEFSRRRPHIRAGSGE